MAGSLNLSVRRLVHLMQKEDLALGLAPPHAGLHQDGT